MPLNSKGGNVTYSPNMPLPIASSSSTSFDITSSSSTLLSAPVKCKLNTVNISSGQSNSLGKRKKSGNFLQLGDIKGMLTCLTDTMHGWSKDSEPLSPPFPPQTLHSLTLEQKNALKKFLEMHKQCIADGDKWLPSAQAAWFTELIRQDDSIAFFYVTFTETSD